MFAEPNEIINAYELDHQHDWLDLYCDAQEFPVVRVCAECGEIASDQKSQAIN